MNRFFFISIVAISLLISQQSFTQGLFGKLKDKVNQKVNSKEDNAIDKTLDKTDNATQSNNTSSNNKTTTTTSSSQSNTQTIQPASVKSYQNYDFRAGDKIIFEDNFSTDNDGEFPAHWNLIKGQAVINKITDIPSFLLTDGNYCEVSPLMKSDSYLTDNFSIEYDTYMSNGAYGLLIYLKKGDEDMSVHLSSSEATWDHSGSNSLSGTFPAAIEGENYINKWHHVAMAYKNDQLKVYVDQYRVLTVPHCNFKPTTVECAGIGNIDNPIIFKDFKIADGASMNMLDAILTSGKFITHGINFDVNSANLKPESMGVINDMVKFMQSHSDLKLEIDGHTDSDGAVASNLTLSQERADAVKAALIQAGIDAARLTTKGFGQSKPISLNTTPEGKANNRRVEFVKL